MRSACRPASRHRRTRRSRWIRLSSCRSSSASDPRPPLPTAPATNGSPRTAADARTLRSGTRLRSATASSRAADPGHRRVETVPALRRSWLVAHGVSPLGGSLARRECCWPHTACEPPGVRMRIPSPPPLLAYLTTGAYARLPPGDSGLMPNATPCHVTARAARRSDASRPPEPLELNRRPDRGRSSDVRVGHSSSTSTRRAFVREGRRPRCADSAGGSHDGFLTAWAVRFLPGPFTRLNRAKAACGANPTRAKSASFATRCCPRAVPGTAAQPVRMSASDLRRDRPRRPIRGDSRGCAKPHGYSRRCGPG